MKIFLNENIPHPHADISTLSTYTDEMEVLILPFCPIKEIKRKKSKKLDHVEYIYVEQDIHAAPIFSLNKQDSIEYWETHFFSKLKEIIESLSSSIIEKSKEALNINNYFNSSLFKSTFDVMVASFEIKI